MARKDEIKLVHPRTAVRALSGYAVDVGVLLAAAQNAYGFLRDETLDADKVRKAVAPMIKAAIDRVARWYEAD